MQKEDLSRKYFVLIKEELTTIKRIEEIKDLKAPNFIKIQKNQWSYKVCPHDSNYNIRQDKVNDWCDFEPDYNDKIESFYQKTLISREFGYQYIVNGRDFKPKLKYDYYIKGTDEDPSTWCQINTVTNKIRSLNRR